MKPRQHYLQAPITEAIIDLRVELPNHVGISDLRRICDEQETTYPKVDNQNMAVGKIQFGSHVATTTSSQHVGFVSRSHDGRNIFQARLDGFTISRLAPYDCWETFRNEAYKLWNTYRSVTTPEKINRLAVRYVNRLDLPLPLCDFKEYLRTVPEVSSDLPQGLSGYFMQLMIPQEDIKSMVLLNEAIVQPAAEGVASIVLDIDVFRADNVPVNEEDIWDFFEKLHVRKNEIFEACITDKARELFQ